ncbi:MAG TPA: dTDP-4-dehydrorhamnose 3,5-epimerase [Ignavibacteriaceae bacterium]|jgi:dTDP-4-dehydrorhamnose 3,5-epimerase|nr:dTDP-4-dehydrorhamnose 3,5-epimerase [Ignavibacteriaceae bacterium]HPO56858.1 dTDP-4-dehydrorhamnose 3,5-epimerase [Ignavibacteriaceae bacterium]
MKIIESCLNGLILIEPRVFNDDRGYFFESYKKKQLEELGISESFVQDNISRSTRNTIRGLHYQVGEFAQGKLCQVLNGRVMDVALDIRASSPTYGEYKSFELSSENHLMLYIPPGFAHGFSVLSETAIFSYKCTAYYDKASERGIRFDDPDLKIDWQVQTPVLSEKDKQSKWFRDIENDFPDYLK